MKCEFCGDKSVDVFVILPIKKLDGCLDTIACLKCAEKSSAYCKKHQRPHLGFADDNTTACAICIEEMIADSKSLEVIVFSSLQRSLPTKELNCLSDWAKTSASITQNSPTTCIFRAVVTKALRLKKSIGDVLKETIEAKSVNFILPSSFYSG